MMTVFRLHFDWPWNRFGLRFDTGLVFDMHKCPRCSFIKVGAEFLGFTLIFFVQRASIDLFKAAGEIE